MAYRLRPVTDCDAPFIVELRNDEFLNRFLHSVSDAVEQQIQWLAAYFQRSNDYYFVIERLSDHSPEGLVSVYDIENSVGEWGRWVLKPGSLAAIECAWLIYRVAFERLKLQQVFCRTIVENKSVVSFHNSCGIPNSKILSEHYDFDGKKRDAVEHRVDISVWQKIAPRLEKLSRATARRLTQ